MTKSEIDKILGGLDKIEQTVPDSDFLEQLKAKALKKTEIGMKLSRFNVLLIAASFAILLLGNVFVYSQSTKSADTNYSSLFEQEDYNIIPTKFLINE